jgi:hypothetical protein
MIAKIEGAFIFCCGLDSVGSGGRSGSEQRWFLVCARVYVMGR